MKINTVLIVIIIVYSRQYANYNRKIANKNIESSISGGKFEEVKIEQCSSSDNKTLYNHITAHY